jgi:hypothetical protein
MEYTAKQMAPAIGCTVLIRLEQFGVPMVVIDVKSAWGKVRVQVAPVGGQGEAWVDADRLIGVLPSVTAMRLAAVYQT